MYLIDPIDIRLDDMIGSQLPFPDNLSNIRGTLGHEKVISQLDAGLAFLPQPGVECLHSLLNQDMNNYDDVLQETYRNIFDDVLELGLPLWKLYNESAC